VFAYIVKRLVAGLVLLVLISMFIFALFWYGPRSPAEPLCRAERSRGCPPDVLERYEDRLGYNNPISEEYLKWAKGIVVGRTITVGPTDFECSAPCLGLSYRTRQPVYEELKERFPATMSVAIGASLIYLFVGVGVGVGAARRRGSLADKSLVGVTLFLYSIPDYLIVLLAMLYFCIIWGIFERGYVSIADGGVSGWLSHLILPWAVLGLTGVTDYARYSRGAMVESLNEDYIRTAQAKGLTQRAVAYKHALRAALVPVVTIFGLDFAFLMGGTLVIERIFDIQGIGLWGLEATYQLDFPVVQATVLFGAAIIIVSTLIVDVLYSVLDPRVRLT